MMVTPVKKDIHRHEIISLLPDNSGNIGVELGVAAGVFSSRMVASGVFDQFFGVDLYTDTHDVDQYKQALRAVGLFENYKLLRMSFNEAYDLFEDESLNFIYVDGYAYSGEEGGETIFKWARKVVQGGVIAGDDYHEDFPLVVEAVNAFVEEYGFELVVTTRVEPDTRYSSYPTWAVVKTKATLAEAPAEMVERGKRIAARVRRKRKMGYKVETFIKARLSPERNAALREWNMERKRRRKKKST